MPREPALHDLAVILVSHNDGEWLRACLPTVQAHTGGLSTDVVVVDNASTDDTAEVVADHPFARIVPAANHGFSYGNNRGLMTVSARYVLFLNPDTEIVEGGLEAIVARMDELPDVGLAGCRQYLADGRLWPTMRRFPSGVRQLCEALFSERWPIHPSWAGERILDLDLYEREFDGDWTSGSCMLARWTAIESAGFLDERFFLFSEETDFALRIRRAGWRVRHLTQLSIVHHAKKGGWQERIEAQTTLSRLLYARKHLSPSQRALYRLGIVTRYLIRLLTSGATDRAARAAIVRGLRVAVGRDRTPPFEAIPATAVRSGDQG